MSVASLDGPLARAVGVGLAQLLASTLAAESIARTQRDADLAVLDRRALALVACIVVHALIEGWRERLRADADHAVALLTAELDATRPHLRFFNTRIVDEGWSYRGAWVPQGRRRTPP